MHAETSPSAMPCWKAPTDAWCEPMAGSQRSSACKTSPWSSPTVGARAGYPACMPANVSEGDARSIVTEFMKAHAEMMQQGAASVAAEALISAFPCNNGSGVNSQHP